MQIALRVKNIDSLIYEFIEFVCVSIYFLEVFNDDTSTLALITKKNYLIDESKVKMLNDNDLLKSKDFVIDIEKKTTTIESCKVEISLKIQFQNSYVRKTIHVQHVMILQLNK